MGYCKLTETELPPYTTLEKFAKLVTINHQEAATIDRTMICLILSLFMISDVLEVRHLSR